MPTRYRKEHRPCRDESGQVQQRDKREETECHANDRGASRATISRRGAASDEEQKQHRRAGAEHHYGKQPLARRRRIRLASRRAQAGDDASDPHVFRVQELVEGRSGQIGVGPAEPRQRLVPRRAMRHPLDDNRQRLSLGFVETRRRDDRAPVFQLNVEPLLDQGRHVETGQPPGRGNADGSKAARFDVLGEFAVAADAGRHLSPDQRRHGFAAAGERDVVRPSRIDAGRRDNEAGEDVVSAAGRAPAPGHGSRIPA